jgi:arginyl-tRNA synthetase
MSKRKGTYITIDDLLSLVPRDIVRFMFSSLTPEAVLGFDLELAKKETTENPYWYVEYAYARMNSILEKLKEMNYQIKINIDPQKAARHLIKDEEIKSLMRSVHKFNDLSQIIVKEFKPNLFYEFLLDFAKKLHRFYENKRIIKEEIDRREILFVKVILNVLGFWLKLMNVEPVKKI